MTDASVVVGPAVAHHGWTPTSYDELAGAVVAGHVIECGAQATGGNFSGFRALVRNGMDPAQPLGFPIAEVAADGSSVITKHDGTGGAVTVDTVTAQLVYEIQSTHYLNPDVTVDLGSIRLEQDGTDRVAVTGVHGEAPPERLKVCVNELGGFRNQVEFVLTGLDVEEKAEWVRSQLTPSLTAAEVAWSRVALPTPDADTEEGASTLLRCTVMDPQADPVGRGVHRSRGGARAGVVPRLHDDHAAAAAHALRRLPAGVRRARAGSSTPSCTPTAVVRWSPTRPSSRSPTPTPAAAPRRTPRPPTR